MAQVGGLGLSLNLGGGGSASDVEFTPSGTISATNVQDAIEELDTRVTDLTATDIAFTPVGDITATTVQDAVAQLQTLATLQHSANITLSGNAAVDITGVPASANEVIFTANGASGSTTSVFFLQIITSAGVQATNYFTGQTTNSASSSAYANANPGTSIPLTPSVANTVFLGGQGVFRRVDGTTSWGFTFTGFSTTSMYTTSVLVAASGGGDILGIRFGVSAGTFDNGGAAISWRS